MNNVRIILKCEAVLHLENIGCVVTSVRMGFLTIQSICKRIRYEALCSKDIRDEKPKYNWERDLREKHRISTQNM